MALHKSVIRLGPVGLENTQELILCTFHLFDWDRVYGTRCEIGSSLGFYAQGREEKGIHPFPKIFARV